MTAATPRLESRDRIAILNLGAGENRLHDDTISDINALLDLALDGPYDALVTSAEGKIWSNGLDIDWVATRPDRAASSIRNMERLFARLLTFPIPTVAAVQGHAFAGGFMLALSHDLRVMRSDRGFLCLPEVDLGVVVTDGMTALLRERLVPSVLSRALLHGDRFSADEALQAGVIDHSCELESVVDLAVSEAARLSGKDRRTLAALKNQFHEKAVAALGNADPPPHMIAGLLAHGRS